MPILFDGTAYIRVGSYNRKLNDFPEKERKIWISQNRQNFEKRIAMDRINKEDLFNFLNYPKYFEIMNMPLESGESLFKKLQAEKILVDCTDGTLQITNLGAILFAKDLSDFDSLARKAVRVVIYEGRGRTKATKELEGKKGYAAGLEELNEYINDQLPMSEEIKNGIMKNIKAYPEIAIRELITNMLIHQDFNISGTGPIVEIFNGRIEFSNPGKPLIDTARFIDNNPVSRNEGLAVIMRKMKMCEERGSGIDKVISESEKYQYLHQNL